MPRLAESSKVLMSFLLEKKLITHKPQTKNTKQLFKVLYNDLLRADEYIQQVQKEEDEMGTPFFNPQIIKINNVTHIPKPQMFNDSTFPVGVQKHIEDNSTFTLSYTFSLLERKITIHMIDEKSITTDNISIYNEHIRKILIWLTIVHEYTRYSSSKACSKTLTLYIYLTSLTKQLPDNNISILTSTHVNTAFTTTCPAVSEIVVFRNEEWFKVLLHETFHNFALDFSDMNMEKCHAKILSIFPVKSEVNLFEAYTEFWAKIMNIAFCSYFLNGHNAIGHNNEHTFLNNAEFLINFEIAYSFFQMVKTLDFMGLSYSDLYSDSTSRDTLYKEDTNVLSYYVLSLILLNNYQGFLVWCETHNLTLLQFKKSEPKLMEFCKFIEQNYNSKSMLESVAFMEDKFHKHKKQRASKSINEQKYIMENMRMSVVELG